MDKRKEANLRVKESITTTLFQLMHEKSISDISISELIRRAGVARVSFYRNYESKEDVLVTLIEDVLEQYRDTIDSNETSFYTYQNVSRSFEFFKMSRVMIVSPFVLTVIISNATSPFFSPNISHPLLKRVVIRSVLWVSHSTPVFKSLTPKLR